MFWKFSYQNNTNFLFPFCPHLKSYMHSYRLGTSLEVNLSLWGVGKHLYPSRALETSQKIYTNQTLLQWTGKIRNKHIEHAFAESTNLFSKGNKLIKHSTGVQLRFLDEVAWYINISQKSRLRESAKKQKSPSHQILNIGYRLIAESWLEIRYC